MITMEKITIYAKDPELFKKRALELGDASVLENVDVRPFPSGYPIIDKHQ